MRVPSFESETVDRPVEDEGSNHAPLRQRANEGGCAPVAMRCTGPQPFTSGGSTMRANHVGLRPRPIDEHQPGRIQIKLTLEPLLALFQDVWPVLFGCVERLFFRVMA